MSCPHCHNGVGADAETCKHCITAKGFMSSLDKAIELADKKDNKIKANELRLVRANLPEYPVMAVMEAEAVEMSAKFIEMIEQAFDVKPFMDANYKKVEV